MAWGDPWGEGRWILVGLREWINEDALSSEYNSNKEKVELCDLLEVYNYSGKTLLQSSIASTRSDTLWFHPTDANQQRIIRGGGLYSTDNAWASLNTFVNITPNPYMIAPWASNDTNKMFIGTYTVGAYHHKIATLEGISDITATGIAGTNCGTPPYTDSIPDTYGNICEEGIQAVKLPANDNTYGMRIFECEG